MGLFDKYFKSSKATWVEGLCKDLDDLGYTYDKKTLKKYYKSKKMKSDYISGVSIIEHIDTLKECRLVKPNLKKALINNKEKCSKITYELKNNKNLLTLNESMLEISYKECNDISEKRKQKDYHFEYLLEDLNLQLFYEDRKLLEMIERLSLLGRRSYLLYSIIELKNTNNRIIDSFMEEFHKASDSTSHLYQYEIEASNILNEKKFSEEEIDNDKDDLSSTKEEADNLKVDKEKEEKLIELLKEQISRVESIIDLKDDSSSELGDLKEELSKEENIKWEKKKRELTRRIILENRIDYEDNYIDK